MTGELINTPFETTGVLVAFFFYIFILLKSLVGKLLCRG